MTPFAVPKQALLAASFCAATLALLACSDPGTSPGNAAAPTRGLPSATAQADDLIVVDCALPPQTRVLGTGVVYAAARRAAKLPANECRIRGGEYVAPARVLDTWLSNAQQGDPEAMTYVGEIYEKGIGVPPDPTQAANWYGRAADKGYPRAEVSLATLYERGAGVPKDPARAIALYRKAAGLPDLAIDPATLQQVKDLQQKLEQRDREIERLRDNLGRQRSGLDSERSEIERLKRDLAKRQTPSNDSDLAQRRQQALAALSAEQENAGKLRARIKELDAALAKATTGTTAQLQAESTATASLKTELQRRNSDLAAMSKALEQRQAEVEELRRQSAARPSPATVDQLQSEIRQRQTSLDAKERQLADLTTRLKQAETERDQLKVTQAGPLRGTEQAGSSSISKIPRDKLGKYYALVIGIDNYRLLPALKTAINDATEISQILKAQYGFEVVLKTDATRHDILLALNAMRASLTPKDNLLIYYAGHGELDAANQHGNWLPIDAEPDNTANWISDSDITNQLNLMTARQVMVIADSCYGGSLTRASGATLAPGMSDDVLLARILTLQKSRMVLSSGGLEPVLDALGGSHSVFATALIQALNTNRGLMSGTDLYQRVIPLVTKAAFNVRARQVPEYGQIKFAGHESGDFFFINSTL